MNLITYVSTWMAAVPLPAGSGTSPVMAWSIILLNNKKWDHERERKVANVVIVR